MDSAKEAKKDLREADELGRILARLNPNESREARDSIARSKTEESNLYKHNLTSKMNRCLQREKEIREEMSMRENVPEGMARENIFRSALMFVLLSVSIMGEFVLAKWSIQPFELGNSESNPNWPKPWAG